jgi:hypothetical protein
MMTAWKTIASVFQACGDQLDENPAAVGGGQQTPRVTRQRPPLGLSQQQQPLGLAYSAPGPSSNVHQVPVYYNIKI